MHTVFSVCKATGYGDWTGFSQAWESHGYQISSLFLIRAFDLLIAIGMRISTNMTKNMTK